MQRVIVAVFGLIFALGAVTFAVAQDGTPTPGAVDACATPAAATPEAATPEPTVATDDATPIAATPEACPTEGASAGATSITIEMIDIAFNPKDVTIAANVPVEINLTNTGMALHNIEQKELGIDVDLGPGESQTITITAAPGEYPFDCNIPGHKAAGMVGTLTVQ